MPHVIIKLVAGRPEAQKQRLAAAVTRAVMAALFSDAAAVSVAIEEVAFEDWDETVYRHDIIGRAQSLYKQPGYNPLI